jgi:MFS family permease
VTTALTNEDYSTLDPTRFRLRVRTVLIAGQMLAGLGMGATLSVGALLATDLSGSAGWSGMAATLATLGAALAAMPLANVATTRGRSWSLAAGAWVASFGALLAIIATTTRWFPLLLIALLFLGVATAVNLQARFAAADVSTAAKRGTDLSMVVWATTVGAVSGPNLIGPGNQLGVWLGLPDLAGPFLVTAVAQVAASLIYRFGLRPDPLDVSKAWATQSSERAEEMATEDRPIARRTAFVSISLSHATMVGVMAMTPVHLVDHGASLVVVGFTISLHIAGMYALSPVFGMLADRLGRIPTILLGQLMLALSLLATGLGSENANWVIVGLILLGLGWSASTVAGSTLLTESTSMDKRTRVQGFSDVVMSGSGALGGALSGVILLMAGYDGLSFIAMVLVVAVVSHVLFWEWRGAKLAHSKG